MCYRDCGTESNVEDATNLYVPNQSVKGTRPGDVRLEGRSPIMLYRVPVL